MGKMIAKPGPAAPLLRQAIAGFDNLRLRVGFFETATYEDGTPVAYVATIHEFGAPQQGIPARPFMRPTAEQQKPEWDRQFAAGARAVTRGAISARGVFEAVGGLAAGNISEGIRAVTSPPLKESTIENKKRQYAKKGGVGNLSKPLVQTGLLIQSPTYVVDGGE